MKKLRTSKNSNNLDVFHESIKINFFCVGYESYKNFTTSLLKQYDILKHIIKLIQVVFNSNHFKFSYLMFAFKKTHGVN